MGNESFCGAIVEVPEYQPMNTEPRQSLLEGFEGTRERQGTVSVADEVWNSMLQERERDGELKTQLQQLLEVEVNRKDELERVQRENRELLDRVETLQERLQEQLDEHTAVPTVDFASVRERAQTDREFGRPEKASLWDEEEVWHWLQSLHCEEYIPQFAALHIDGNSLVHDVKADHLASEFLVKPLHIPKLQREILKLQHREMQRFELDSRHAVTFVPEVRLQDEIASLQVDVSRLQSAVDDLQKEKSVLEDQLATYASPERMEEVEEQLERVLEEKKHAQDEARTLITSLVQDKEDLEQQLDRQNELAKDTGKRVAEEFGAMQTELNDHVDTLKANLARVESELMEKEKELAKSIAEKEKIEAELSARVETLQDNRDRQEEQMKDLQNSFASELGLQQAKANTEIQMLRTQVQESMIRFHDAFAELKEIQEAATAAAQEAVEISHRTLETSEKLVTTKEKETGEIINNWQPAALQRLTDTMIADGTQIQNMLSRHGLLDDVDESGDSSVSSATSPYGRSRRHSLSGSDSSSDDGDRSSQHGPPHGLHSIVTDIARSGDSASDSSLSPPIVRTFSTQSTKSTASSNRSGARSNTARSVGSPGMKRLVTAESHYDWTKREMEDHALEMKREMVRLVRSMEDESGVQVAGELPPHVRTAEDHLFRHESKGKWTKREIYEMQEAIVSEMAAMREDADGLPFGTPLERFASDPAESSSPVGSANVKTDQQMVRRDSDGRWDSDAMERMQYEMQSEMERLTSVERLEDVKELPQTDALDFVEPGGESSTVPMAPPLTPNFMGEGTESKTDRKVDDEIVHSPSEEQEHAAAPFFGQDDTAVPTPFVVPPQRAEESMFSF